MGLVKTSSLSSVSHVAQIGVSEGEVSLEVGPSLVSNGFASPLTASVDEHAGVEHDGVCVGHDLFGGVRLASGVSVILGIFNLLNEGFEGLSWVVGGSEPSVVDLVIHGSHLSIGDEEMVEELVAGDGSVPGVAVTESSEVDVGHGRNELLLESSLYGLIETEEAEVFSMLTLVGLDLCNGGVPSKWRRECLWVVGDNKGNTVG